MTLSKEYSIAADSTLSISPLPVKRATRTYGRPKDTRVDPADSSITDLACNSTSRQRLYRTAPPNLEEEVPPSSDVQLSLDDDDEEGKMDDNPLMFPFPWKKKLWDIDNAQDNEDTQIPILPVNSPSGNAPPQAESKESDALSSPQRATDSVPSSPRGVELLPDVFGGPLPTASSSQSSLETSHVKTSRVRNRIKKPSAVVHDSDEDEDEDEGKPRSSPTSPAFPHPINTPQSRSSPTPPTSEAEEEGDTNTDMIARNKGKGKARDVEMSNLKTPASRKNKHEKTKPRERKSFKEKAPAKKLLRETTRARFRVPVVQHVSIPRPEEQKYTIRNFFSSLSLPSSDPIESFSSPQVLVAAESEPDTLELLAPPENAAVSSDVSHETSDLKPQTSDLPGPAIDSDSDLGLPEVGDMLKEQEQKRSATERARALAETKRRALAEHAARREMGDNEDSDDDLEIVDDMRLVAEEETGQRKAMRAKHARLSEGRKRQLLHGKVPVGHGHHMVRKRRDPLDQLKAMAKPSFESSFRDRHGKPTQDKDAGGLNRVLRKQIDEDNANNIRKKEEEWVRRGGQLLRQVEEGSKAFDGALMTYAEKALKATETQEEEEAVDESDQEWTPETRGSASPRRDDIDGDATSEQGEISEEELNTNGDEEMEADENVDDSKVACPRIPRHAVGYPRAVIDSDEEDSEGNVQPFRSSGSFGRMLAPDSSFADHGMPPPRNLPIIVHRRSSSSLEDRTEDETDKENNTRLMYDKSEDKENKAVVRHSPFVVHVGARGGSLEGLKRSLSISPGAEISGDENEPIDEGRAPFKELLEHDDPFVSQPLRTNISFTARLQQTSPISTQSTLAPQPLSFDASRSGFSQFLDGDENRGNSPLVLEVPKLQGLSQPFEFGTEAGRSTSSPVKADQPSFSPSPTENVPSMFDHLRKAGNPDDLSLSLDVRLQPALEVNENFQRQAESIFEKEQEYLLEAARRKPKQTAELYVNDHGFLTQTRPDVSTPEIYRFPSPSQSAKLFASQSVQEGTSTTLASQLTQRRPLRTLSLSQDLITPSRAPLARLRRRSTSPLAEHTSYRSTPSPSPQKRVLNAFDVLARNARAHDKVDKEKKKLENSEFVETEALESDEDERLGFGVYKKMDGDEEGGTEDLDKNLEELVDDAHMDTETQAADLVLEKVKEHQEEDDRALEKYHRDAAEGKHRVKRRGRGLDMDESDDEDDEDEAASRIRRQMRKKRKIEGDNLEALGQNEETRPFYEIYQRGLIDDAMDFEIILPEDTAMSNEEQKDREAVSTTEVCERAREVARMNKTYYPPDNASWQSQDSEDDSDDHVRIKEALPTSRKRPVGARTALDQMDFDGVSERPKQINETEPERARLLAWAKGEKGLQMRGTARSAGASSSVTGHGKPRVKAGGGSVRTAQHIATAAGPASTARLADQRKLEKSASILAGISDRTPRFEHC